MEGKFIKPFCRRVSFLQYLPKMLSRTVQNRSQIFLTICQTAKELQVSERTLRSLIATGEIKATRLGKRIVRIPRTEIERLTRVRP